jgi:hypothetical protein
VALVIAAAIAARFYGVHRFPGIIGDEAWYGVQAQRFLTGEGAEYRTPTGNLPGAIQFLSLSALHQFMPPSALTLRIPALLSSIAAIAMAGFIARRHFGRAAGWTAAALMACLPLNIAYARLGWDPSHTVLLVLVATYAALERRILLATLCFAFALANHPSAVFAAPFLLFGFLGCELRESGKKIAVTRTAQFAASLAVALLLSRVTSPSAAHHLDISRSLARLIDAQSYVDFLVQFGGLLSGDTLYRFIVGEGFGSTRLAVNLLVIFALTGVVAIGLIAMRRQPNWPAIGLVAGWIASLAMLYVIAGWWALQPSVERFGLALVPATVLSAAAMIGQIVPGNRPSMRTQMAVAGLGLPLLAGFIISYLVPLDRGLQHPGDGLSIGLPGLNSAALDHIETHAGPGRSEIIAEDWWIYWPIAYQADPSRFSVKSNEAGGQLPEASAMPSGSWWITYRGSKLDRHLSSQPYIRADKAIRSSASPDGLNIWKSVPAS